MKFSEIYGHEGVKNILKRAIDTNTIGHAYIFEGTDGCGKFSLSLSFASMLMCENTENGEMCGECQSCRMCLAGSHPDVRIITNGLYDPSKKSASILTDTIRQMKQEIYLKPSVSDRKVYIIPDADTMNISAQNSLLKILEEPPLYCTIIMIAQNSGAFLDTVLSRANLIKFSPLESSDIKKYLIEEKKANKEKANIISLMSAGSIGKAIEILESEETFLLRDEVFVHLTNLLNPAYKNMFNFIKFLKSNKNLYKDISEVLKSFFSDLLKTSDAKTTLPLLCPDKRECLDAYCKKLGKGAALELLEILLEYSAGIDQNVNYSASVQMMIIDFWEVIHDRSNRNKI